jgi:hypothetical protein
MSLCDIRVEVPHIARAHAGYFLPFTVSRSMLTP